MNNNNILKQFNSIFSVFMVLFYIGLGIFLLFYADKMFNMDKAIKNIMGVTLLLYGIYRIFVTYRQISEAFFSGKNNNND
ncbi:MAG: hypothetical protein GXY51_07480 [Bacteroidetes bacterium]|jgi:hypothetical protein|nr:hypothetical protein [Bacteroidota bacterium]